MTASLRIVWVAAALVFLAAGPEGCTIPDEFTGENGGPAALDQAGAGSGELGEETVAEGMTRLENVAMGIASGNVVTDVAWSEGYTSVSIHNDHTPPPDYPGDANPSSQGDLWSWDFGNLGENDDSGNSGGGNGSADGRGCEDIPICEGFPNGCRHCYDWGGDYVGDLYCHEEDTLEGFPDGSSEPKSCSVSMSFDSDGVPEWIPTPVFVFGALMHPEVRFVGETVVCCYWSYDVTVTVVSASYTPTTADVELEVKLSLDGERPAIWGIGVHTVHTEIDGDSVLYSSQTHYDGMFFAAGGDPDNPGEDWNPNVTQDFDCHGSLLKP